MMTALWLIAGVYFLTGAWTAYELWQAPVMDDGDDEPRERRYEREVDRVLDEVIQRVAATDAAARRRHRGAV